MSSLEAVARKAGVSRNTVARALSGDTKATWDSTARRVARIQEIARELGYMPNAAARATRKGRFNAIALLLSTREGVSTLPKPLLNGIVDTLQAQDRQLLIQKLSDEEFTDASMLPSLLKALSVDGLLINYTDHLPAGLVALIRQHRLPSIWLNSVQSADAVRPDDEAGVAMATRALVSDGHRRIAYVDYSHALELMHESHYSAEYRASGYRAAVLEAGLEPQEVYKRPFMKRADRLAAAGALLGSAERPTACVAYSNGTAIPLAVAALRRGLRLPEDLSITTIDAEAPEHLGVPITLLRVPEAEVGRRAVAMLDRKLRQPGEAQPPEAVPFELIVADA